MSGDVGPYPNMLDSMTRAQSLRNSQQENQLRQLQIEGVKKTRADQDTADQVWKSAVNPDTGELDPSKLRGGLASGGIGTQIPEVDKKLAEIDKLHGEGQVQFAELVTKHMALAKQDMDGITTPAQYLQHVENSLKDPVLRRYFASHGMTPEQIMAQTTAKLAQSQTTPTGFEDLLRESKLGADKALEVAHADLGNKVGAFQKFGGRLTATYDKGVDPTVAAANGPAPTLATIRRPGHPDQLITVNARNYKPGGADIGDPGVIGESKGDTNQVILDQREIAAHEKAYPKATSALAESTAEMDKVLRAALELRSHPGLSNITGTLAGRTPNISTNATSAQALLDTIQAKGQFGALSAMRAASPTGGALGNVSDTEGRFLRDSFATLKQSQGTPEFKAHLDAYIADIQAAKQRAQDAYKLDFAYRDNMTPPAAAGMPSADAVAAEIARRQAAKKK
jgi:hypothetical protein